MGIARIEKTCSSFCFFCFGLVHRRRRQPTMISSSCFKNLPITSVFVLMLLMFSLVFPATSAKKLRQDHNVSRPQEESNKMNLVKAQLMKINKPYVKSIQSPDGDTIDCVLFHHQPAFDDPKLNGTIPMDPPERPDGYDQTDQTETSSEYHQLWSLSGESCPEGTIPIRRTTEEDILRASSIKKFRPVRRDASNSKHEHAVGTVRGNKYYGSRASINVWAPKVTGRDEFSLAQLWVISGESSHDTNTIEAGWQVSPGLYGDYRPRLFTYWTANGYRSTGCYNLQCPGFVQTSNRIAIGTAIYPTSVYNGHQFDITLMIWKDPKHGNWWLEYGKGELVGYWPASLFTHLGGHATMLQYGGEAINIRPSGPHTTTQMGSGHFPSEGYGKSTYIRSMQVVDWGNNLIPASNVQLYAERPNCYDVRGGYSNVWGTFIFFGGPGKNPRCP